MVSLDKGGIDCSLVALAFVFQFCKPEEEEEEEERRKDHPIKKKKKEEERSWYDDADK